MTRPDRLKRDVVYDDFLFAGHSQHDTVRHDAAAIVRKLPTNYIGNKKRLLWPMIRFLERQQVPFTSVLDAFSGSGVVSVFFALMGKRVTCNDLLASSAIQAECMLRGIPCPLQKRDWDFLIHGKPRAKDYPRIATEYYVDKSDNLKLFRRDEAEFLDRYRQNIEEQLRGKELRPMQQYALYAMLKHINDVCFVGGRYYNGQTLAKVEHRINHDRNQGRLLTETFQETIDKLWFPPIEHNHKQPEVFCQDVMSLIGQKSVKADLLYLDPPYGGASSDYVMLYQFLEEFIHQKGADHPEMAYLKNDGDRFNDHKGYADQFRSLLAHCERFPYWLMSFNDTSFASRDEIVGIVKEFRTDVIVESELYGYKSRKDRSASADCEHFILARPSV